MSSGILGPPNADVATPLATPNCCSQKRPCMERISASAKVLRPLSLITGQWSDWDRAKQMQHATVLGNQGKLVEPFT